MNYLKIISATMCSIILLSFGCSDTESTPGVGFIPKIKRVVPYNFNDTENPYATYTFQTGDVVSFSLQAQDSDYDMETIWWEKYAFSDDTETLLSGPDYVTLPEQTSEIMTYTYILSITVTDPAGEYRVDFQVEDVRENMSDMMYVEYTVY